MIGYHYTSEENWQVIQKEGLNPYPVPNVKFHMKEFQVFAQSLLGVWIWPKRLRGEEHVGSIFYQAVKRPTLRVVLLEVIYGRRDRWMVFGQPPEVLHEGTAERWQYHHNLPGQILIASVPPERIRLVATYDLKERLA